MQYIFIALKSYHNIMDEVDYSQFYYRPEDNNRDKPPKREKKRPDRSEKSRKKNFVLIITAVIMCFAILFLCVDFFGKGFLIKKIGSLFNKTEYSYYLVVASFPTRDTAYAGSLTAETSGGAGYTFKSDNSYLVALSAYSSEPDARSVASKNGAAYFVHTLSFSTDDVETANLIDKFIRETDTCCYKIESGLLTESELNTTLNNYKVLFSDLSEKKKTDENTSSSDLLDFIVNSISGINAGITNRTQLLFQLRYCMCTTLFSARESLQ